MSTVDITSGELASPSIDRRALGLNYLQRRAAALLPFLIAFWAFCGGFVLFEPSPYELMFVVVAPVALVAGFNIYRGVLPLFLLLAVFVPFCFIAAFQVTHSEISDALIYSVVTVFLWVTAFFIGNYVADSPHRHTRAIMRGYVPAAVIAAVIGTLAYLGLIPGAELFLRFGRAKATFGDPNVYGPFLMLPAMFVLQRILLSAPRRAMTSAVIFTILFVGIFVSFSRAAWGHLALSSLLVYLMIYALEARGREKVRLILLALAGAVGLILILAVLLSIDTVRDLFMQRFALVQNYDTGASGRFGRLAYALELAISNPWGIGPGEFSETRIVEDPHNTYIKALLAYGWLGGFAFIGMILITLWQGLRHLLIPSPNRLVLIPVMAVYIALVLEAAIIDADHWRHFFLVIGLIWGITAGYSRLAPRQRAGRRVLV